MGQKQIPCGVCGKSFKGDSGLKVHQSKMHSDDEYKDEEKLRELYVHKEMTIREISNIFDCTEYTIGYWMEEYGIDRRKKTDMPGYSQNSYGYIQICHRNQRCYEHRLLATLLVDDLDDLSGMEVHHKNEVPWDNRLNNLEVVDMEKHREKHNWHP